MNCGNEFALIQLGKELSENTQRSLAIQSNEILFLLKSNISHSFSLNNLMTFLFNFLQCLSRASKFNIGVNTIIDW